MKKTKANTLIFILFIFRKCFVRPQNMLNKKFGDITENIFAKLSSSERKKVFSELLTLADSTEKTQFERYFEEYNKEHKSGLLDFLKKKK